MEQGKFKIVIPEEVGRTFKDWELEFLLDTLDEKYRGEYEKAAAHDMMLKSRISDEERWGDHHNLLDNAIGSTPKYGKYCLGDVCYGNDSQWIYGYEVRFKHFVKVACISYKYKVISPTHGYYPEHTHGCKMRKLAKDLGYDFKE